MKNPITLTAAMEGRITFSNGMYITDYHGQECCERVYADFESLADQIGVKLPNLDIETVPDAGFRVGGLFVPCYNVQNGYYDSDLSITIWSVNGNKLASYDIDPRDGD